MFSSIYVQASSGDRTSPPIGKEPASIPLSYLSIFSGYMTFKDQPVLPWKEANDQAGEIGGWRFYAREGKRSETEEDKPLEPKPSGTKQPPMSGNSDQRHEHGSKP